MELDGIRNISLDRTLEMELTDCDFIMPEDFDAREYYANTVGIYVNDKLKPQKVVIRAFGIQVEYLRSLPLHSSQKEITTVNGEYSDFQYRLCLTPELSSKILSMGEKVKVISPEELKEEIKQRLLANINLYSNDRID